MTKEQVEIILTNIGEQEGQKTKLTKVSSIMLYKNLSLYPDDYIDYYFDGDHELLLEYEGEHLSTIYDYSQIFGFTLVGHGHPKYVNRVGVSN